MARRLTDTYFVECKYFYKIKRNNITSDELDGYNKFLIEVKPQEHIINGLQDAIRNYISSQEGDPINTFITITRIYISNIRPL